MDTAAKRFAAVNLSSPWRNGAIVPDGSLDRQAVPYAYNGISWIETPGAGDLDDCRFSIMNLSSPWRGPAIVPDGTYARQAGVYGYQCISWEEGVPEPPQPPHHGSGGRGKGRRGRTWGYIPDEDLPKRVQVLLEKTSDNRVTSYELVEWEDDPSLADFTQAIQALQEELGKHDGSSAKATSLRAKIKKLKNKRNQRIIFMTLM